MKKSLVLLLAVCLAGALTACQKSESGTILTGADKDAVLAFTEPKTDNLIAGLKSGDYMVFSKDFDTVLKNYMPEGNFEILKQDRDAKLGGYVSRQVYQVVEGYNGFYTVIYDAVFERDKDVIMRVVFRADEPHEVSGIWFNK